MTDPKNLIIGMALDIARAPYGIAQERNDELHNDILGQEWPLGFLEDKNLHPEDRCNFRADPLKKEITATFSALLSLWAIAYAAVLIGDAGMAATRFGQRILQAVPGSHVAHALALIDGARGLI